MASIVKDKYERQLIMMEQNGLNRLTYWLVTYTFHYLLYIPIALEIGLTSLIFQIRIFTQVGVAMWGGGRRRRREGEGEGEGVERRVE